MPKNPNSLQFGFFVRNWKEGKLKCFCSPSLLIQCKQGTSVLCVGQWQTQGPCWGGIVLAHRRPQCTLRPLCAGEWDGPRQPLTAAHASAASHSWCSNSISPKHHDHLHLDERRPSHLSFSVTLKPTKLCSLLFFLKEIHLFLITKVK